MVLTTDHEVWGSNPYGCAMFSMTYDVYYYIRPTFKMLDIRQSKRVVTSKWIFYSWPFLFKDAGLVPHHAVIRHHDSANDGASSGRNLIGRLVLNHAAIGHHVRGRQGRARNHPGAGV